MIEDIELFVGFPFDLPHREILKDSLVRAVVGLKPSVHLLFPEDRKFGSPNVLEELLLSLGRCHLFVGVFDGRNPNVAFELGAAVALRKRGFLILAGQKRGVIPYALQERFWATFDAREPERLEYVFRQFVIAATSNLEEVSRRSNVNVFLCHRSLDKELVEPLAARLQGLGFDVWYDSWNIVPGDSIPERISYGIEKSTHFLLFLSSNTSDSRWVSKEFNSALSLAVTRGEPRLIPIFLDEQGRRSIPAILHDIRGIDYRGQIDETLHQLLKGIEPHNPVAPADA